MEHKSNRAGRAKAEGLYTFRNLLLWKKGQELALAVVRLTENLPRTIPASVIGRQVVAAAGSISANVAEGHGRFSQRAYRNHLSIARGSAAEVISWLDLLRRAGYVSPEVEEQLSAICEDILGGLTSQMRALSRRLSGQNPRVAEDSIDYGLEADLPPDEPETEVL